MKILLVHPAARFAVADVANGYAAALRRAGHEVKDYFLHTRIAHHQRALPQEIAADRTIVSKLASETILNEALYCEADLVVCISGLNLHPIATRLTQIAGIPTAAILTESPYEDAQQAEWVAASSSIAVFTNERFSAERHGWGCLPPSFDPAVHKPVDPDPALACDVLFVGTGWGERQTFLEAIDWTGIALQIHGVWPDLKESSPLWKFYHPACVDNTALPKWYRSAKICLNFHRRHAYGWTLNPRAYELAAIGAFQLSDPRADGVALFGDSVPTFTSPQELEAKIRFYLAHPAERESLAAEALVRVQSETFDARVTTLLAAMKARAQSTPTPDALALVEE